MPTGFDRFDQKLVRYNILMKCCRMFVNTFFVARFLDPVSPISFCFYTEVLIVSISRQRIVALFLDVYDQDFKDIFNMINVFGQHLLLHGAVSFAIYSEIKCQQHCRCLFFPMVSSFKCFGK